MSQVERFHGHTIDIAGQRCSVAVPGAVFECDDPQCADLRSEIETVSHGDREWLEDLRRQRQQLITEHMDMLSRIDEALALKTRREKGDA